MFEDMTIRSFWMQIFDKIVKKKSIWRKDHGASSTDKIFIN